LQSQRLLVVRDKGPAFVDDPIIRDELTHVGKARFIAVKSLHFRQEVMKSDLGNAAEVSAGDGELDAGWP